MRIAIAQISSGTDPDANLAVVGDGVRWAAAEGADLVVFPEATMCRFGVPLGPIAQPLDGPWGTGIARLANEHGLTVVAGMFTPADGRVHNTLVIARPGQKLLGYNKIHLYDAFGFRESNTVAAGSEPVSFGVGDATVGVATCYDIRFPELFTALAAGGADTVVVPASWGAGPGKLEQWRLLTAARALDSSSYLVAVGQALPIDPDVANGRAPTGIGHSIVADPFGHIVHESGDAAGFVVVDTDPQLTAAARETIAVLANKRL